MVNGPSEDDFFFDSHGWYRNDKLRRYELYVGGAPVAVMDFDQVRLAKKVDGHDGIERIIEQGYVLRQKALDEILELDP